jgi:acetyl esterase/lipase
VAVRCSRSSVTHGLKIRDAFADTSLMGTWTVPDPTISAHEREVVDQSLPTRRTRGLAFFPAHAPRRRRRVGRRSAALAIAVVATVAVGSPGTVRQQGSVIYDVPFRTRESGVTVTLDVHSYGPGPAVVLVHGGGWSDGDKSTVGDTADALAAEGFVVFAANYRLSCTDTANPLCGYHSPVPGWDVRSAVRWVRDHGAGYQVVGGVGVAGLSAGGNLAALSGVTGIERPGAVVAWSGAMDLTRVLNKPREAYVGCAFETCPELWDRASPLTHADPTSAPLYMSSGEFDPLVPPDEQDSMLVTLQAAGVDAVHHLVVGSDCHANACLNEDPTIWTESVEFLHAHLDLASN